MAPGSLDVGGAEAVDQRNREIAEGGHNLWGEAFAQAGTVFPKADITHRMGSVFDTPMPTIGVQQALGTRLRGREGGDEINDLGGGFARLGHGASELSHLRDKRPVGSQIGIHLGTDLDGAHLNASSSAVNGLGLQVACARHEPYTPAAGWATSAAPAWQPGSHWFSRPRALARTFPGCDG